MKKNFLLAIIIATITIMTSCKDEISNEQSSPAIAENKINTAYPSTTPLSRGTISEFEADWENQDKIITASGQNLALPWSTDGSTSGNLEISLARDIKKEDGWIFLFHTFNDTDTDAYRRNYMGFYNQRTGMMKVFYYLVDRKQGNNGAAWQIELDGGSKMLNMVNDIADPIDKNETHSWLGTNMVVAPSKSFSDGWNCFQLPLAYAPRDNSESFLAIRNYNTNEAIVSMFGTNNSYSSGTILTKGSPTPVNQLDNGSLTINGKSAEQWIDDAIAAGTIKYTNTRVDITKTIEVIGKVANVFNKMLSSFKKEEPTVIESDLEFTTKGVLQITGTTIFPTTGEPLSITIPFDKDKVGELGAWNLSKSPVIYMNPLADCAETNINPSMGSAKYKLRGIKSIDCDVVINPSLQPYVKRYWVETEMVRYWGVPNDTPVIPDYYTDFGTLGRRNAPTGFQPEYKTENLIYESAENNQKMYKYDMKNTYTVTGVKNTRGYYIPVYQNGTPLSTIFVPNSSSYNNQFFELTNAYLRVKLYMVTEMHGKEETTMSMRTFIPKIEWDTQLYNAYKNLSPEEIANL